MEITTMSTMTRDRVGITVPVRKATLATLVRTSGDDRGTGLPTVGRTFGAGVTGHGAPVRLDATPSRPVDVFPALGRSPV